MFELDVETLPFRGRHDAILRELDRLRPGEHMVLVSDHMPLPLRFHLQDARPGRFRWNYLESSRRPWRIEIRRIAP